MRNKLKSLLQQWITFCKNKENFKVLNKTLNAKVKVMKRFYSPFLQNALQ